MFTQRELMIIWKAFLNYEIEVLDKTYENEDRSLEGFDGRKFKIVSWHDVDLLQRKIQRIYREQARKG